MRILKRIHQKWFESEKEKLHRIETEWNKTHINERADTVRDMFPTFKHIIRLDGRKIAPVRAGLVYEYPIKEFKEMFMFPNKELGDHTVIRILRGVDTDDDRIFELNELGGYDYAFAATNNDEDASFIVLRYS